jgi:hypothetical protein
VLRHTLMVVVFVMSLAGCAAMEAPGSGAWPGAPPETFAHRVATSEVVLLWNCLEPEPGRLRVEGVAQNPWQSQPISYLEFDLVGVNAQNRTTAETTEAARDFLIYTNQSSPFRLDLQTTGTEVRFDLYYHYRFNEEFDMDALIAGPPVASPRLPANQNQLVRDVCSPTQHRAH